MRAASQTKAREAANATSRAWSMWKRQVFVRSDGSALATSSAVRTMTVVSLARAAVRRALCSDVSTSWGFLRAPEPATIMSAGTVTA
jgi:hypothetical protein